ncbi:methyltransferase domain-containing protein [Nakamurella sp. YIM 132087]|uniref:Methyltransferase domain-containing protein n=1 Tax=Nakamurella alba TaxID=2665158 RepID=A0A7K1FHY4_9ACTN|nr:O-methyltransferase [Nakamurella alba]MTD13676.1 methyltransferase domain-containing protein [Nakamurella alba]
MTHAFADLFVPEDEHTVSARNRSADLGLQPVSAGAGTALTFLAAACGARAVVEVGTGTGVSGLHLLAGMTPDGVLTSIDLEAEHQRAAKESFSAAGVGQGRARLINGRALDVLPRLTDGAYDLVLVDGDRDEFPEYVPQAIRLLRPGGVLVLAGALHDGKVSDPTQRDSRTVAVREAGRMVRDEAGLVPVLLPVGDGLLAAVKRS